MLLLVDAGNTRVKWALVERAAPEQSLAAGQALPPALGQWKACGTVARGELPQLENAWRAYPVTHALLSNVAGPSMRGELEKLLAQTAQGSAIEVEWFASLPELAGIRNAYRNPAQLGCDRFASAIGAHALYPARPLVVATCGTATTIDAVAADGTFIGGMILPGLGLMARSLAANTAQLPQVGERVEIDAPFADNTDAAIVSGCIAAQAGAIERALKAQRELHGEAHCIISGGAGAMIAPHLSAPYVLIDNLVLIGLQAAQRGGNEGGKRE